MSAKKISAQELVTDAMLAAMHVALSFVAIRLGDVHITFESLPTLVAGAMFGPWDGLAVGLLGSFIGQMIEYGFSATTLLWILPAGVRGLLVGFYARRRGYRMTPKQSMTIAVLSALAVTALNTLAIYADSRIYGYYKPILIWGSLAQRVLLGVATAAALGAVLPGLLTALRRRNAQKKDEPETIPTKEKKE